MTDLCQTIPAREWCRTEQESCELCLHKARIVSCAPIRPGVELDGETGHVIIEWVGTVPDHLLTVTRVDEAIHDNGLFRTAKLDEEPYIEGLGDNPWMAFSPDDIVLILEDKSDPESIRLVVAGHSEDDNSFTVPFRSGVESFVAIGSGGKYLCIRKGEQPNGEIHEYLVLIDSDNTPLPVSDYANLGDLYNQLNKAFTQRYLGNGQFLSAYRSPMYPSYPGPAQLTLNISLSFQGYYPRGWGHPGTTPDMTDTVSIAHTVRRANLQEDRDDINRAWWYVNVFTTFLDKETGKSYYVAASPVYGGNRYDDACLKYELSPKYDTNNFITGYDIITSPADHYIKGINTKVNEWGDSNNGGSVWRSIIEGNILCCTTGDNSIGFEVSGLSLRTSVWDVNFSETDISLQKKLLFKFNDFEIGEMSIDFQLYTLWQRGTGALIQQDATGKNIFIGFQCVDIENEFFIWEETELDFSFNIVNCDAPNDQVSYTAVSKTFAYHKGTKVQISLETSSSGQDKLGDPWQMATGPCDLNMFGNFGDYFTGYFNGTEEEHESYANVAQYTEEISDRFGQGPGPNGLYPPQGSYKTIPIFFRDIGDGYVHEEYTNLPIRVGSPTYRARASTDGRIIYVNDEIVCVDGHFIVDFDPDTFRYLDLETL